jgi:Uma2 family endonuclease
MSTIARISLEEYDRMIDGGCFDVRRTDRIELIRGELRKMAAIGPAHEVGLPKVTSAPHPDLAWVAAKRYSRRPDAADVFLVIEVAYSSLNFDRDVKSKLYAKSGVGDYWIVNIRERCVEVRRQPSRSSYKSLKTFGAGEVIQLLAFPDISLDVKALFDAIDGSEDASSL